MRVLVCGGRGFYDWRLLEHTLYELNQEEEISAIIHGAASGADSLGRQWANYHCIEHYAFPANWKEQGPYAGGIRNQKMLDEGKPDIVIAFPGNRGTKDLIGRAQRAGIKVVDVSLRYPTSSPSTKTHVRPSLGDCGAL